jgi:hypothetical protein
MKADFNSGEFATIKSQTGLNSYKLNVKDWVTQTNAIGPRATAGRYGGTYAHPDIAFNMTMFGQTANDWRNTHPNAAGNMRDDASIEQLLVLTNLESLNAEFIHMGVAQSE